MVKSFLIRDEIHGDIDFPNWFSFFIDHKYFQRLRGIKQLGLTEYVFPCATHTRFQHSLGVGYLSAKYFNSIVDYWNSEPELPDSFCDKTFINPSNTIKTVKEVIKDKNSYDYWLNVVTLAGLLHDIGHGPWSHAFQYFNTTQDFNKDIEIIPNPIRRYLEEKNVLSHEDVSVIYLFHILNDLEEKKHIQSKDALFLPLSCLINKKIIESEIKHSIKGELEALFVRNGIAGGYGFFTLMKPILSGAFDVDRIDYIQRDGKNCGVFIGAIEWQRIIHKVIPCLSYNPNPDNEPEDVVLITELKNQHVLDDFIFSLFQMYTQVYYNPTIIGFEESINFLIKRKLDEKNENFKIDFELHSSLSDEKMRMLVVSELGVKSIEAVLKRTVKSEVFSSPDVLPNTIEDNIKECGFHLICKEERRMLKDRVGVFVYFKYPSPNVKKTAYFPWRVVSPIAQYFDSIRYSPKTWIKFVQ